MNIKNLTIALSLLLPFTASASLDTSSVTKDYLTKSFKATVVNRDAIDKDDFEREMSSCAMFLSTKNYVAADNACSNALTAISNPESFYYDSDYFLSLAYSNRGIARHYLNDATGAFNDFNKALTIDDNYIVSENFEALTLANYRNDLLAMKDAD